MHACTQLLQTHIHAYTNILTMCNNKIRSPCISSHVCMRVCVCVCDNYNSKHTHTHTHDCVKMVTSGLRALHRVLPEDYLMSIDRPHTCSTRDRSLYIDRVDYAICTTAILSRNQPRPRNTRPSSTDNQSRSHRLSKYVVLSIETSFAPTLTCKSMHKYVLHTRV